MDISDARANEAPAPMPFDLNYLKERERESASDQKCAHPLSAHQANLVS